MFKRKAFKRFVALVTVLLLMFSTISVGFAATNAATDPTVIYATKDGKTLMFTYADLFDAYASGNVAYQALWEGSTKLSVTVGGKNVSFPDFVTAFGTGAAETIAAFAATADSTPAPEKVSPVTSIGTVLTEVLNVKTVNAIADINVAFGTALASVGLPTKVTLALNNNTTVEKAVTWDAGTPAYNGLVAGAYNFSGTVAETTEKATVKVIVGGDAVAPAIANAGCTFVTYTTLKVAFTEKVDGTPVVKVNGTVVDAANVKKADDGMSLTIINGAGYTTGTYTVVVNGLKDLAQNPMMPDATVLVNKVASVYTSFAFTTKAIVIDNLNTAKLYFDLFDQFGQEYASISGSPITIKAEYNGFPVVTTNNNNNEFTVTLASAGLVKGRVINVTAYRTDNGSFVQIGSAALTVTDVAAAPDAISITAPDLSGLKAGDVFNLTAGINDQYTNPVSSITGTLRWATSNKAVVAFNANPALDWNDAANGSTFIMAFKAIGVGTATVTVYLPDGSKSAVYQVTVGKGTLSAISTTNANVTVINKAAVTGPNVVVNPTGQNPPANIVFYNNSNPQVAIPVSASSITLTVTAPTGFNTADITVVPVVDANGNLTGLTITSNRTVLTDAEKAGNYGAGQTYTVEVKSSATGVAAQTFTVTSKIDAVVTGITVQSIGSQELPANSSIVRALSFVNQYGEAVNVKYGDIALASGYGKVTLALQKTKIVDGSPVYDDAVAGEVVTGVKFTAAADAAVGSYTALVTDGVVTRPVTVPVVEASKVTGMTLNASSIYAKVNDSLDVAKKADDYVVVNGGNIYIPVKLTFNDQYGNTVPVVEGGAYTFEVKDASGNLVATNQATNKMGYILLDDLTNNDTAVGEAVAYIAFMSTTDAYSQTLTINVKSGSTVVASAPLNVIVQAARALDHLTVVASAPSVVVGGKVTYTVSGVDQYGDVSVLTAANIKMVAPQNHEYSAADATQNANGASADLLVTTAIDGNYSPVFYIDADNDNTLDSNEMKVTATTLAVGQAGSFIKSLVLAPSDAKLSSYLGKVVLGQSNQYAFTVTAYSTTTPNAASKVVLADGNVFYTIVASTLKNGDAAVDSSRISINSNGVLTVNVGNTAPDGQPSNALAGPIAGSVTVRVTSVNGVTADSTITLNSAASVAQAGTYYLADDANGLNGADKDAALTTIELKEDEGTGNRNVTVKGTRHVYLLAIDQYGDIVNVDESAASIVLGWDSSAYFTATKGAASFDIKAKAVGSTTLRVFLNGVQIVSANVVVYKDAVDAALPN